MNGHFYFEIHADIPERAIQFYQELFGWKFSKAPDVPIDYWRIETGGSRGGLLRRPSVKPPAECGTNAFVCSLEVKNFDETASLILKHGGETTLPKFAVPNTCWQGYFTDTEGNNFGIFEVDEAAK